MTKALEMAFAFAGSDLPVLLLGETGTGKELFARLVHQLSSRSEGPMVTVNCAGIPESLVESTLFGHKRGAFTGAVRDKKGRLDAADHGTIFFDELGDLPLAAQAKLLRVLQDGIVEPVGSTVPHRVDVRVVAATNQDLRAMVRERHFRKDLYYRLNAGDLHLPPLRERRSDIPSLALHILDGINRTLGQPKRLAPEALIRLQEHNWPGNVRDLENVLVRTAQLCPESVIASDGLQFTQPAEVEGGVNVPLPHEGFSLEGYLDHVRTGAIRRALEIAQGNQSRAGRLLGITPQAVSKFLREQRRNVNRS
jgi:transcriptional regulator with PAS, ATPase and Fis domain